MTTENQTPAEGQPTGDEAAQAAAAALAAAEAAKAKAPPEKKTVVPVEGDENKDGTFSFDPTGDNKLDMALTFVGKHGFGPGHPAIVAAVNGDFSLLKAQLAEKNVAGADAYLALAESAYERIHGEELARRAKDKAMVEEIVGGPEAWAEVQKWAGENADADEKTALQSMLGKGGAEAKIAAGWLAANYQRATGGIPEGEGAGPRVSDLKGGAGTGGTDALSPREYSTEVSKLRQSYKGGRMEDSAQYKALGERRARYKG